MRRSRSWLPLAILAASCGVAATPSAAFELPDTGLTKCYQQDYPWAHVPCGGTGQDGSYTIHPMRFTDNGDGTVTDDVTGLVWQREDDGATYNWYVASGTYEETYNPEAQSVCGALTLGNSTGWRLPTRKELLSIVDYGAPAAPAVRSGFFTNAKASEYWTATRLASDAFSVWRVDFATGAAFPADEGGETYVRCVRGTPAAAPALLENGDGTVTDTRTGLIWQQGEPGAMDWGSALSHCEALTLGGSSSWRLPNVRELESLVDEARADPAVDATLFPDAVASRHWTSTAAGDPQLAWHVDFSQGAVSFSEENHGSTLRVRCVHGGESTTTGVLTVTSIDPAGGVEITVTPNDNGTLGEGVTPFTRTYDNGVEVRLTAPAASGDHVLDRWSGCTAAAGRDCSVAMDGSTHVTAQYAGVWALTVASTDPASGVGIEAPRDLDGAGNGETPFTRRYLQGGDVYLVAPWQQGAMYFDSWTGCDWYSGGVDCIVSGAGGDRTVTAHYTAALTLYTLTVVSTNPGSGAGIQAETDFDGLGPGETPFTRRYLKGYDIGLVASLSTGGTYFESWSGCDNSNVESYCGVWKIDRDRTVTANYSSTATLHTVTVGSTNPGSGVAVAATPVDFDTLGDGETPFTRRHLRYSGLSFRVPLTTGGRYFDSWAGCDVYARGTTCNIFNLLTDRAVTANYADTATLYTLAVSSSNPESGVPIGVSAADFDGAGDGGTPFTRRYLRHTAFTLVAPPVSGGRYFDSWSGCDYAVGNRCEVEAIVTDLAVTANYTDTAPTLHTLTIASSNPATGVGIEASADFFGDGAGVTPFTRRYPPGTAEVTVTAPWVSDGRYFDYWTGCDASDGVRCTVSGISADRTVTAHFSGTPTLFTLTVASADPASGVGIAASDDFDGAGYGETPFTRRYPRGTDVSLTAPATHGGGYFDRWTGCDGYVQGPYCTVSAIGADRAVTAHYTPTLPAVQTVTVASADPAAGVGIWVSTDLDGAGYGETQFARRYLRGTDVYLTAPMAHGGRYFDFWTGCDGYTEGTACSLPGISADRVVTAHYTAAMPPVYTLTVASAGTAGGVGISASIDLDGAGYGETQFARRYLRGTDVYLDAPAVHGGRFFASWTGCDGTSGTTCFVSGIGADRVVTASYHDTMPTVHTLTVASTNPAGGVGISASNDIDGAGDGVTLFTRRYFRGTDVGLSAPETHDGRYFASWTGCDGYAFGTFCSVSGIGADRVVTANYRDTMPEVHTLTVASTNPASGVIVSADPDVDGAGEGETPFTRRYLRGASFTLWAPAVSGGKYFASWTGCDDYRTGASCAISGMVADRTVTANYADAPPAVYTLTVASADPPSGVGVGVEADIDGAGDGVTPFARRYLKGADVGLAAPATSGGGYFDRWTGCDAVDRTYCTVSGMGADRTVTAHYTATPPASYTLTVASTGPMGGAAIGVQPADIEGGGEGATPFARRYLRFTEVVLTAPVTSGGWYFSSWTGCDGGDGSGVACYVWGIRSDRTVTANYAAAPPPRTLSVASANPSRGVAIAVSATDREGRGGGTTPFTRTYDNGSQVTLTAPAISGSGNTFMFWEGCADTAGKVCVVTADAPRTAWAYYASPDRRAPSIVAGPYVTDVGQRTAYVQWQTNEPARGGVRYGTADPPDLEAAEDGYATDHGVLLAGLAPGTVHYLRVYGADEEGNGPAVGRTVQFSTASVPDQEAPVIETGPVAAEIAGRSAAIWWHTDEPADGTVRYGTDPGTLDGVVAVPTPAGRHQVALAGLAPDTVYFYSVASADPSGNRAQSPVMSFRTLPETVTAPPRIVRGPLAQQITGTEATIAWATGAPATCVVSFGSGGEYWDLPSTTFATEHLARLTGLAPSVEYRFWVVCVDGSGGGQVQSADASFETVPDVDATAPVIVSGPEASAEHVNAVIRWETDEAADAVVEYGRDPGALTWRVEQPSLSTEHTIALTRLAPGTTYRYRVLSRDAAGNGPCASPEASFTTRPAARAATYTGLRISYTSARTALVSWETDVPADTVLEYFPLPEQAPVRRFSDERLSLRHAVYLTGLLPGRSYEVHPYGVEPAPSTGSAGRSAWEYTPGVQLTTLAQADVRAPVITQAPVVESLGSDRATVRWVTDEVSDSVVRFADDGGGAISVVGRIEDTSVHAVVLTNLRPETTYHGTVSSADPEGNGPVSGAFSFTTPRENRPPTLAAVGSRTAAVGVALTFRLAGADPDGDTLAYSSPALPAGATLDAATGDFRWTPQRTQVGTRRVTFRASDGSLFAETTVTITVRDTFRSYSSAAYDGWVLESAESSNRGGTLDARGTTLRVGDDAANRQYRAVLSFDTRPLPDKAVIVSARLKVRYQGRAGTNPFATHGNILVDAKVGAFSGSVSLQAADFQAVPTRLAAATIRNAPVSGWYSTAIATGYVNRTGLTQFRLRFAKDDNNDRGADYLLFFSGGVAAVSYRPLLEVVYTLP